MTRSPQHADVTIVGAGPVGLFGAYYSGVRGLRTVVVDSLPEPGGQVAAMYPEKSIYDVAGFPDVRGRVLIDNLVAQASRYEPTFLLDRTAISLDEVHDDTEGRPLLRLSTSAGDEVLTKTVILTAGIGTFTPRPLPAGEAFLGRGLAYFVPALDGYAGADVVVVGGGDSACDWALTLEPIARSVTVVHRRKAFRAHAATVAAMSASSTRIITDAQVTAIRGTDRIKAVEVTGLDGTLELPADHVIAALGFTANLGPLRDWGLELANNRHIVVDTRMATTRSGVFAAGDVVDYPGKVRLIAVGFGEVATAVNNAAVLIDPEAEVFPGHSTDNVLEPLAS